jgi:hypothetical protein
VLYQIDHSAQPGGGWFTRLEPPQLTGAALIHRTRWRVELPPAMLPLYHSANAEAEQTWSWRGWFEAAQPAELTAEMDRWFDSAAVLSTAEGSPVSYSYSQLGTLAPVELAYFPQQLCLLAGSLAVLLAGYWLWARPPRYPWLWFAGGAVLVTAGLVWIPQVFVTLIYAVQPGVVVLGLTLGLLWLRRRNWQRRIARLPGFTRLPALTPAPRSSVLGGPREQPSTVDAAHPRSTPAAEQPAG